MSTIRWVDLLSSESNLSHSVTNNEDVAEKAKKKKFPYSQERDLNSSFLNSYNGDLDNSNVGINLKIKNMSIGGKKEKEEKPVVSDDRNIEQMTRWGKESEREKNLPSGTPKGEIAQTGDGQSGKSAEGERPNDSKIVHSNAEEEADVSGNVMAENVGKEENCVNEKLMNPSHGKQNQKDKSVPKVDSADGISNSSIVIEKSNRKGEQYLNAEENPTEENNRKKVLRRVSVQSESSISTIEGAKKVSGRRASAEKKRNSSNISTQNKGSRNNKIKNVSVDKESIQNSYFARYIVKKGGENRKIVGGESVQGEVSMGTPHKGKKRKDRALLCENSTTSKFNCTLSHDVTVDDNNVPLNPTKKVKSRVKQRAFDEGAVKEGVNVEGKEGTNIAPGAPGKNHHNKETKVVTKSAIADEPQMANQDRSNLEIMENMSTPRKKHLPTVNHYKNLSSDNIDMEKFKNFDANFINYLGDIQSQFSDPFVNSNSNRVNSRLKEIAVGKSTKEYKNYVKMVKYEERMDDDPTTPNAYENVTNAKFQAKYNLWRKKLHKFDSIG
ncbi:conserved Plasmodium protein, unknown function [Plasmodium knowlesi strain H]|uniref:Histone RNA hairpin-binding protein RNA-binding domain-containing protein n=3 Tax=Plasmodium knowlesi TaxID=5850 RepID=A0A5K1VIY2_PLAKH|nr:RNA-binding protein, putative [Plasmodium knowlesi strain H]OTN67313.1 Uncharacterized protein PKNOH_S06427800 [Plasmodium knowlesi]CAA9987549.1 RNA-binding protein, putative [Plasmodium knowlesi strain H]SBO23077.1 conserved Plasmodium protein, unknown function [Plasmodium knowlesi strain H]SBO23743.1 conserved Plasmodium protein, unknown function [Plasmodium knowlesi strain H]VVS77023.1 RNA-binding protein, putative [Plasmodium knowlesi strain H]|eukprot:XP_002258551.1 hypothetical protein, conserved in Plasmodium species [Plasmodium knowlesi strain H]